MDIFLLGTGGGPRPTAARFPTSQAVVTGERCIVIDAGNGAAQQMARAGLPVHGLTDLLITHLHVDHAADLGMLPLAAWVDGRTEPITVAGPPPTTESLHRLVSGYEQDLIHRMASTGRPDVREMLRPHDISTPGVIFEDDDVRVSAALVNHPPFEYALAYRVDSADGSVVVSGDTTPCEGLDELAVGADVLIHEVVHPAALEELSRGTNAPSIRQHMLDSHTMLEDVGGIAQRAGVHTLVLSHMIPHTGISADEWLDPVRASFTGQSIIGHDLDRLRVHHGTVTHTRSSEDLHVSI
ncbi:MBL fold metallo-hydrolase [Kocuria sp.]|uniref:MBL fold metallo-hydrolase n=1 Tax=Kocuria sp. TaxID=1871328 RepID=UPI0025B88CF3|nr:MBL fold metallo-hydrolase [Kocuria sp.]